MPPETGDRSSILQADPRLSRFNPLPRILAFDDFDEGTNGWCELVANHDGNLDDVREVMADLRPPQLSNCTFFDTGTHGSASGNYALKLATRARPFHTAAAIKRLTFVKPGLVQFETYFTYKSEQVFDQPRRRDWDGNVAPSELNFGDITISNDVSEGERGLRYQCALRYANATADGKLTQRWQHKTSLHTTTRMHLLGQTQQAKDFHVAELDDWNDIPGGHQPLCYNETSTKVNWHYLRWLFDTRSRRSVELQTNNLVLDLRDIAVPMYEHGYRALSRLLNFVIDVRTRGGVRNFLYLDSALISVDW
ncbi:MAG: hypothetical protein GY953_19695 [bacterium]|nr:hypothetical protein [bacterium]